MMVTERLDPNTLALWFRFSADSTTVYRAATVRGCQKNVSVTAPSRSLLGNSLRYNTPLLSRACEQAVSNILLQLLRARSRSGFLLGVALAGLFPACGATLPDLVADARPDKAPPTARTRLAEYVHAHSSGPDGATAMLALGLVEYEHNDFAGAARDLKGLAARLPKIADYVTFYEASALAQIDDHAGAAAALARDVWDRPQSPLKPRAVLLRAQELVKAQQPGDAATLVQEAYKSLPQPDGDLTLAQALDARGEGVQAAAFYQKVYYSYPATQDAATASAALDRLHVALGKNFPLPAADQLIERPSKWIEAHQYIKAKQELHSALSQLTGIDRDRAQVRMGLADLRAGNTAIALRYLQSLRIPRSDPASERDEYLVECGRRMNNEALVREALASLEKHDPKSPWRLKALLNAANTYLVSHEPEKYEPLYRAVFENFPDDSSTAVCHWRVTWEAYLARKPDAERLLREQVSRYPSDNKASSAMYFLGRLAEDRQDWAAARAWYERILLEFPQYYYSLLAKDRLAQKSLAAASASPELSSWLDAIRFPAARKFIETPDAATTARIVRSRALRNAGYNDWADGELRFGAKNDGEPHLLAIEMASAADTPAHGLRMMKNTVPDYLSLTFDSAPARFWQLLFPLPYRTALDTLARERNLDPFMVAGLIRQESEFNPGAKSRAHAYGLTQILPSTGRQLARMNGIRTFTVQSLLQPETNLKLGTTYLQMLLLEWGGKWEETLASYNAGKTRVVTWLSWRQYREPAEFVESIPFTETREYVQAVIRNAAIYRALYGGTVTKAQR